MAAGFAIGETAQTARRILLDLTDTLFCCDTSYL